MELVLDDTTKNILDRLNEYGKAYIVGGYIRDSLLGTYTKDIDIATNLPNEEILQILKEYNPTVFNEKYHVIIIKSNDKKYEIARLREDIGILDGRNPKYVNFVDDIEKDIKRRDFTINSFYYNTKLIDKMNGIEDLNKGIIRSIGDPVERLAEDRIRILRAFRFMAKLGFSFDNDLEIEIARLAKNKMLFSNFSSERLILEFNKILLSKYADKALYKMFELDILKHFIKRFSNKTFNHEVFKLICMKYKILIQSYKILDLEMIYSCLFAFSGKSNIDVGRFYENDSVEYYEEFRIKFLNNFPKISMVKNLIYYHNIVNKRPTFIMLKRMLLDMVNNKNVCKLFNLIMILFDYDIVHIQKLLNNIQILYMAEEPVFLSSVDLEGVDLYNLGFNSKNILEIRLDVFNSILKGEIPNSKYDLINYVLKKYANNRKLTYEKSSGAIVYRKINGKYEFLIIRASTKGSFGFPKGHIEKNETEIQAAIRETKEETNIDIAISDTNFKKTLKYIINGEVFKEVSVFLAEAKNYDIKIDENELSTANWLSYKEAMNTLTYVAQRKVLRKAMLYLY